MKIVEQHRSEIVILGLELVNVGEEWISFEQYLKREHDVKSPHGICPATAILK